MNGAGLCQGPIGRIHGRAGQAVPSPRGARGSFSSGPHTPPSHGEQGCPCGQSFSPCAVHRPGGLSHVPLGVTPGPLPPPLPSPQKTNKAAWRKFPHLFTLCPEKPSWVGESAACTARVLVLGPQSPCLGEEAEGPTPHQASDGQERGRAARSLPAPELTSPQGPGLFCRPLEGGLSTTEGSPQPEEVRKGSQCSKAGGLHGGRSSLQRC